MTLLILTHSMLPESQYKTADGDSYNLFGGGEIQRSGDGTSVLYNFQKLT